MAGRLSTRSSADVVSADVVSADVGSADVVMPTDNHGTTANTLLDHKRT